MIQIFALIATVVVAVQVIFSLVTGSEICPNGGCRFVESLTVVSSLVINILGLAYFQAVYWALRVFKRKPEGGFDVPGLLLLAGLAAEGVLLAYQLFVAHVLCGYCLLVLFLVAALNGMYGRRQQLRGAAVFVAVVFSFSLLTFMPARVFSQYYSLKSGSYGVRSCAEATREIFLIVSSDCSHCRKVIQALDNCNSCDFYLNPVDKKADNLKISGLKLNPSYSPEINRLMLAMLGIKEVPVLVVKNRDGYSFIKGEEKILNYVRHACFSQQPVLYFDQSLHSRGQEMTVLTEDGGECALELDCKEP